MQTDSFFYLSRPIYHAIYRLFDVFVVFEGSPNIAQSRVIESEVPFPLRGKIKWISGSALFVSTVEWFEVDLRIAYNEGIKKYAHQRGLVAGGVNNSDVIGELFDSEPDSEDYLAFNVDINRWLSLIRGMESIKFVYTSELIELPQYKQWLERSIPSIPEIVPLLARLFDRVDKNDAILLENISLRIANLYAESDLMPTNEQRLSIKQLAGAAIAVKTGIDPKHWNEVLVKLGFT